MMSDAQRVARSRTVQCVILIASWTVVCIVGSAMTSTFGTQTFILFDVLLLCGAALGSWGGSVAFSGKLLSEKPIRALQLTFALLLAAGVALSVLSIASGWVIVNMPDTAALMYFALAINSLSTSAMWVVLLLALCAGIMWGVLCVRWVVSCPHAAKKDSAGMQTTFEALVLFFGALGILTLPMIHDSFEGTFNPLASVVASVAWALILWPVMKTGAHADTSKSRQLRLGHYLGLLALGGVIADTLLCLVGVGFLAVIPQPWICSALLLVVGCGACFCALHGSHRITESSDKEERESAAELWTRADSLGLTVREYEVLKLVVAKVSSKDIGSALGIAPSTAREYARRARAKLAEQGLTEKDALDQAPSESKTEERGEERAIDDTFVLFMTSLVGLALSPFGTCMPADSAFVAALLVGFAAGGLAVLLLRTRLSRIVTRVEGMPQWLCVIPPFVVLMLRLASWWLSGVWLIVGVAVASAVMGLVSFWVWGRLGKTDSVMEGQEPLLHVWLLVLGGCNALLWLIPESNAAFVVPAICSVVLACGLLAAVFIVARWAFAFVFGCYGVLIACAVFGGFGWPSGLMSCVFVFVPWVVAAMKAERDEEACTRICKSNSILASVWILPAACALGALLTIVFVAYWLLDTENALWFATCVAFVLLTLVFSGWFVFALNTSVHVERGASLIQGDREQLVRAWLSVRGVNGLNADVAIGLARGGRVTSLAEELGYSPGTIRKARQTSYRLLRVHSVVELCDVLVAFVEANAE